VIADELRHHDPFGLPELLLAHEPTLHRLRAASILERSQRAVRGFDPRQRGALEEVLGGYIVLRCNSIDEACQLARFPRARHHSAIEVRPID
jgi:hypothetical protein